MKLKSCILTIALALFAVSGLLAQDKYEYATVIYEPVGKSYIIYYSDLNGIQVENGKLQQYDSRFDHSPVMKYLNNLVSQSWEVYSVTSTAIGFTSYHLRKKKN